ncbi:MAG: hypothetical protein ABII82_19500 [Verrucomicrobiota bacterium]
MKKTTAKSAAKTPAPAKKAPAKTVKKAVVAPVVPAPKPVAKKAVVKTPAVKKPAVKKAAPAPSAVTRITAAIDVGFGNSLYLRGEGGGLSWDKGVLLDCVADDSWTITLAESSKPIECKFLLNDVAWCVGNDYIVPAGSSVVLKPTF